MVNPVFDFEGMIKVHHNATCNNVEGVDQQLLRVEPCFVNNEQHYLVIYRNPCNHTGEDNYMLSLSEILYHIYIGDMSQ